MIVANSRTGIEKLKELLATGTECNEPDLKETLDFGNGKVELDIVKNTAAMFSRYPGGYIIGVTNAPWPQIASIKARNTT